MVMVVEIVMMLIAMMVIAIKTNYEEAAPVFRFLRAKPKMEDTRL